MEQPLKILFVAPYLPSLIRVRPYNLIKHLAQQGHQITLLALEPPGEDTSGLDQLRAWCHSVRTTSLPGWRTLWNGVRAIPGKIPFQAAYSRSPAMADLIRQTQSEATFDIAHVEHLRGAELSSAIKNIPIVFDSVDSITLLFEQVRQSGPTWRSRLLANLDLTRTRRYEARLLEEYPYVLVTSPRDKEMLVELSTVPANNSRLVVLPNGVDLDYFSPMNLTREPATLIFTGKMSYHANVAAAVNLITKVMPLVWEQLPEARLTIAGKDPSADLLSLAEDPRITVTGTVPDLRPYLAQATTSVSPMRYGVGIQNKVLEAMAMETPVISTPQAVSALQTQVGEEVMVADTPQAIAETAVKVLTNEELRRQIGMGGRRYVETYHNWNVVTGKLAAVYREAMASWSNKG